MEGLEAESDSSKRRHSKLRRLPTKQLITQLSKSSQKYGDPRWQSYFKDLSAWLHQTIDTRHLAVHGCQFFDGVHYKVVSANNDGSKRTQEFSETEFIVAIQNADKILRSVLQFLHCDDAT